MKDIQNVVTQAVKFMAEDGTIEKMIFTQLEKTINSLLVDCLREYSDFGKSVKEKISESINQSLDGIKFPLYNKYIAEITEKHFRKWLDEEASKHLSKQIEEHLPVIKKEGKFSELVNEIENLCRDEILQSGENELKVESTIDDCGKRWEVKFEDPSNSEKTEVTMYNFDGKGWHVGYISSDGRQITGSYINRTCSYTTYMSDLFYRYWAMGTVFEDDIAGDFDQFYFEY